jgi:hypothetical protein
MAPCGIKVAWKVPDNGGVSITKFRVEFKLKDKWIGKVLNASKFDSSAYFASDILR